MTVNSEVPTPARADSQNVADDHTALRTWLRLLTCHNLIESRLRALLRTQLDTTLPRFDLMAQLARHPEGIKMGDLSRLLMVSGGNVTGVTDRLVDLGLIERREDPTDRRAYYLALTPEGQKQFHNMATLHEQWVSDIFEGFNEAEMLRVSKLLAKLKRHLNHLESIG